MVVRLNYRIVTIHVMLCAMWIIIYWNVLDKSQAGKHKAPMASGYLPARHLTTATRENKSRPNIPICVNDCMNKLHQPLQNLSTFLLTAKVHARGVKTLDAIDHSMNILKGIMTQFPYSEPSQRLNVSTPKRVCPEQYRGKGHFVVQQCDYGQPIEKLVTIVALMKNNNKSQLKSDIRTLVRSVQESYNGTSVIIAAKPNIGGFPDPSLGVQFLEYVSSTDGGIYNELVKKIQTPYALIARNIRRVTDDVSLERLVREIETLQVAVAAGAMKFPDGHWAKGCFQSVHRNFILKYVDGYDESFHECLFCDFVTGPFVTSVETLKRVSFDTIAEDEGLFEDWFLRLSKQERTFSETVLCPDSMFNVEYPVKSTMWQSFMRKWNVFTLVTAQNQTILAKCVKNKYNFDPSKMLPPCLREEYGYFVTSIMQLCETHNFKCQIDGGALLGALKFSHVLPWERDVDIRVLAEHFSAFKKALISELNFTGNPSHYGFRYKNWRVDVFSSNFKASGDGSVTKVKYHGIWIPSPNNPGQYVREVYGRECYKHALHPQQLNIPRTSEYRTGTFMACKTPNLPDCLNLYKGDGNLAFEEQYP